MNANARLERDAIRALLTLPSEPSAMVAVVGFARDLDALNADEQLTVVDHVLGLIDDSMLTPGIQTSRARLLVSRVATNLGMRHLAQWVTDHAATEHRRRMVTVELQATAERLAARRPS